MCLVGALPSQRARSELCGHFLGAKDDFIHLHHICVGTHNRRQLCYEEIWEAGVWAFRLSPSFRPAPGLDDG